MRWLGRYKWDFANSIHFLFLKKSKPWESLIKLILLKTMIPQAFVIWNVDKNYTKGENFSQSLSKANLNWSLNSLKGCKNVTSVKIKQRLIKAKQLIISFLSARWLEMIKKRLTLIGLVIVLLLLNYLKMTKLRNLN